jgi:hypothetical protein
MVNGMIIEKKELVKEGFDFTAYNYKAIAHFADGSCLRGVSVLEHFCYSLSSKDKVLVFRPEDQEKGFRLERIYEN